MKNELKGFGKVFGFTFMQAIKGKAIIVSTLMLAILSAAIFPPERPACSTNPYPHAPSFLLKLSSSTRLCRFPAKKNSLALLPFFRYDGEKRKDDVYVYIFQ